ncbi:MAG: hydantoinase B/oxoprolinase family protein [Candidatus Acidiferrales bacterium]
MNSEKRRSTDAITTEVIRYELVSAAEEMKRLFKRTTTLAVLYELNDFGISIYDADLNLIADVPGIPLFSGTLNYCVRSCIDQVGLKNLAPDDVITTTLPFDTGSQPIDAALVAPVFCGDEIVAYTSLKAHMGDLGAIDPYPTTSTDMFQEGLMMPALFLFRKGEVQEQILRLIKANSRIPNTTATNFLAGASALRAGARRVTALVQRHGKETFRGAIQEMISHGERIARAAVEAIPDGTWEIVDWMDNNGVDSDPVKISVRVTIRGGDFIVDLSDSAPQQRGPINSPLPGTVSACRYALKAITTPLLPVNEGHFRPLKVIAPSGSIFHPQPPAACFLYAWPEQRLFDLIPVALAKAIPDRVPAHSGGDCCDFLMIYFDYETGRGDYGGGVEAVGMGATRDCDGEGALLHHCESGCCNIPNEVEEWRVPVLIERYELRPDSGGPGKFRGGVGAIKEYRTLAPTTAITIAERTEASKITGIDGGKPGLLNAAIYYPGTPRELRRGKHKAELEPGDSILILSGGGAGWGDAFERDPQRVLADVIAGYVSRASAERDYGVVLKEQTGEFIVDLAATEALRAKRLSESR